MADFPKLRDFIYLDTERAGSLAAQLGVGDVAGDARADVERTFLCVESALLSRGDVPRLDGSFDYSKWTEEGFSDGQIVVAGGMIRLLDFNWLAAALGGLPAVLRKMSKIEMAALRNSPEGQRMSKTQLQQKSTEAALRNSPEGQRMSKTQLQQKSTENQAAIAKVEEFKVEELGDVVRGLYGDVVRLKIRPSKEHPRAVLIGSAYSRYFYDSPAALSSKYGVEVDAGWTVVGQLNVPKLTSAPQPIPTGNQMEDSFEQIAMLMNNAFRVANAPAFPSVSFTPIGIYRVIK
jgi:hypothetical protein